MTDTAFNDGVLLVRFDHEHDLKLEVLNAWGAAHPGYVLNAAGITPAIAAELDAKFSELVRSRGMIIQQLGDHPFFIVAAPASDGVMQFVNMLDAVQAQAFDAQYKQAKAAAEAVTEIHELKTV